MIKYLGAGLVIAILAAVSYYDNSRCASAGGVLLRASLKAVCVRNLEIIK
jgi:hypothetical protein